MKIALILAAISAAVLIPLAARAVIRRFKQAQSTFDTLVDEAAPPKLTLLPDLELLPDGFTCLGCMENPALPSSVWCTVCSERVAQWPAEPIHRSAK